MTNLKDMTEFVEWCSNEGMKLGKYDMKMVYVESMKQKHCVCGSPLAIEPTLEKSGYALAKAWTEMAHKNGEEDIDITEDDLDFISDMGAAAYKIVQEYLNMDIVFISTEY